MHSKLVGLLFLAPAITLAQVSSVRITNATGGTVATVDTNGVEMQGAGVAGTPAGGVVSIQGVASGTTVPVSGTVTVTDGAGAMNVIVDSGTLTAVTSITNAVTITDGAGALNVIVDSVTGTVTVDSELPAAAAITDNFANPTTTNGMAMLMGWDGAAWDRVKVNASGELVVTPPGAPTAPQRVECENSATVAGAAVDCDTPQIASGLTAKLQGLVITGYEGNLSCVLQTVQNASATDRAHFAVTSGAPTFAWEPPHKDYIAQAESVTAGLDAIRVSCTNREPTGGNTVSAKIALLYDEA